jgi:hypothetical protein
MMNKLGSYKYLKNQLFQMKAFLILISVIFLNSSSVIHQDTLLQIDRKGNIVGLPEEFSPAKFDMAMKKLRINDKEIVFPECLSPYFEMQSNAKLNLSASWYHSKEILPYYLNFKISNKRINNEYSILVDLETLELIFIQKSVTKGSTTYSEMLELKQECNTDYKNSIKVLK